MSESGYFTAVLACKGRRKDKPHRKVVVYAYDGPVPPPPSWGPKTPHSTFELHCPRCDFAPRPGNDGMRKLIGMAAAKPGRILYIDGP